MTSKNIATSNQNLVSPSTKYSEKNVHHFRIANEPSIGTNQPLPPNKVVQTITSPRRVVRSIQSTLNSNLTNKSNPSSTKAQRKLSFSAIEQPQSLQTDKEEQRRKRSWDRLTSLLKRAIDDVYMECEAECTTGQERSNLMFETVLGAHGYSEMCQEVVDILEKGLKDFIELKRRVDLVNSQDMNIAWTVRPTSNIKNEVMDETSPREKSNVDANTKEMSFEEQYEQLFGENSPYATHGKSWADLSESPQKVRCSSSRSTSPMVETTGNAWGLNLSPTKSSQQYQLHQKLSSPTRRKLSSNDIRDRQEEKLARAEWNRNSKQIQNQLRAQREAERTQQVTERKAEQIAMKKEQSEEKVQRAQKNHSNILKKKSEDAKMENMKVDEIRFIQKMNTEDTKFQLNKKLAESKLKRDKILTERKEKIKEESVKEAAAKKKREEIEMQRLLALESQLKMKKEKEERLQEEKRKKSAERQSKTMQYEHKLQKTKETKINELEQMKNDYEKRMEASAVRKSQSLEMKREKAAAEVQKVKDVNTRKTAEKDELSFKTTYNIDDKTKRAIKKRTKKIRHRLMGQKKKLDVLPSIISTDAVVKPRSTKIRKNIIDLYSQIAEDISKISIETITSLKRNIDFRVTQDIKYVIHENVAYWLIKILEANTDTVVESCVDVLAEFCQSSEICSLIISNLDLIPLIELLSQQLCLDITSQESSITHNLCTIISQCLSSEVVVKDRAIEHTIREEIINYIVALETIDQMKEHFLFVISTKIGVTRKIVDYISLLHVITSHFSRVGKLQSVFLKKEILGCSTLLKAVKDSALAAIPSLLAWTLQGNGGNQSNVSRTIGQNELQVVSRAVKVLNNIACMDLALVQESLGETFQSELFHIGLSIISICTTDQEGATSMNQEDLYQILNDFILLLGFFSMEHPKNQEMLRFNNGNDILLQRLCSLPIRFFTDPALKSVLIPTLVSICDNNEPNKQILEQQLSTQLITSFMESISTLPGPNPLSNLMYSPKFRFSEQKIRQCVQFLS